VQADLNRGAYVDPVARGETFGEYATTWLAQRADLRPRTTELYEGLLNRHLPSIHRSAVAAEVVDLYGGWLR